MASILDILTTNLGKVLITKALKETGETKENVSSILGMVLPLVLGNFKNKIQEGYGKELSEMLKQVPDPAKFMKVLSDKEIGDILHCGEDYGEIILGENLKSISTTISSSLGIEEKSVQKTTLISIPVVVAILSIQQKKENLKDKNIESLIDSALGSSSKFNNSFIDTIFNTNEDPNFIHEASETTLGKKNTKESVLKGYTGGK